jgi:excisionase family DNA binding protein
MKARRPSGTSPQHERSETPVGPNSTTLATEAPTVGGRAFDRAPSQGPQAANDSGPSERRERRDSTAFGNREPLASNATQPTDSSETSPPTREILTVDELADFLRLNRKTVYEAIDRGEIPGVRRIGESYRIHRATVLEWFASSQGRVSHSRRHR